MELAKDNLEPATQRDIRDTQAIMIAGFELCLGMLKQLLEAQSRSPNSLSISQREKFERKINELRVQLFSQENL